MGTGKADMDAMLGFTYIHTYEYKGGDVMKRAGAIEMAIEWRASRE